MNLLDVRRLTGPGLLLAREGAALEVALGAGDDPAVEIWRASARRLLDAVGWRDRGIAVRRWPGGASLAIEAPFDALFAACDLAEAAWASAEAALSGRPEPDVAATAAVLRATIEGEQNPRLEALRAEALRRGVAFLWDAEIASAGLGAGSSSWPLAELPAPDAIDWSSVRDVPVALVTGTNGKTTTVRLLAAIARAAGLAAGLTSTDGVEVGGETIASGDYSGSEGARRLLRDRRIEVAVLEVARGGLLRRGLALARADAAAVTNAAADHLGEYGICDEDDVAAAKLAVARAIGPAGRLALNADDPRLAARGPGLGVPLAWFALEPDREPLAAHRAAGGAAAYLDGGSLVLARGGHREAVAEVGDLPLAYFGAARHNVANALAAVALADALGLPREAMRAGLARVGIADNPGRSLVLEGRGATILVDYAHNPHGFEALGSLVASLPARRRILLFGQAGDRDDRAIRDLARAARRFSPDVAIVKEMPSMLRGRAPGEVPALLAGELRRLGVAAVEQAGDELAGVERALSIARPGDLVILLVHTHRREALERIAAWRAAASQGESR
ncbi:MAG TPA: Mur ligase family protein [Thermoanaerobaculia bacterium]|nr:Mur ligase family protein [Thermoanaerobaculia bacterium]